MLQCHHHHQERAREVYCLNKLQSEWVKWIIKISSNIVSWQLWTWVVQAFLHKIHQVKSISFTVKLQKSLEPNFTQFLTLNPFKSKTNWLKIALQHELLWPDFYVSQIRYLVLAQQIWNWCTFDFSIRREPELRTGLIKSSLVSIVDIKVLYFDVIHTPLPPGHLISPLGIWQAWLVVGPSAKSCDL